MSSEVSRISAVTATAPIRSRPGSGEPAPGTGGSPFSSLLAQAGHRRDPAPTAVSGKDGPSDSAQRGGSAASASKPHAGATTDNKGSTMAGGPVGARGSAAAGTTASTGDRRPDGVAAKDTPTGHAQPAAPSTQAGSESTPGRALGHTQAEPGAGVRAHGLPAADTALARAQGSAGARMVGGTATTGDAAGADTDAAEAAAEAAIAASGAQPEGQAIERSGVALATSTRSRATDETSEDSFSSADAAAVAQPVPLPFAPAAIEPPAPTGLHSLDRPPATNLESTEGHEAAHDADPLALASPVSSGEALPAGPSAAARRGSHQTTSADPTAPGTDMPAGRPSADGPLAPTRSVSPGVPGDGKPGDLPGGASLAGAAMAERERAEPIPTAVSSSFAQGLRSLLAASEPALQASAPPAFPITVPFGEPRFGAALGERVSWLVREGLQNAELTLNPPDLGPIRIELSLQDDAASFGFNATQAETRAAIEQALPRLRELLAEQGLRLDEARIGAEAHREGQADRHGASSGQRTRNAGNQDGSRNAGTDTDGASQSLPARTGQSRLPGRVDLFA